MIARERNIDVTSLTGKSYTAKAYLHYETDFKRMKWWIELENYNEYEDCYEMVELPACNGYIKVGQENGKSIEEVEKVFNAFDSLKCIDFSMDM